MLLSVSVVVKIPHCFQVRILVTVGFITFLIYLFNVFDIFSEKNPYGYLLMLFLHLIIFCMPDENKTNEHFVRSVLRVYIKFTLPWAELFLLHVFTKEGKVKNSTYVLNTFFERKTQI